MSDGILPDRIRSRADLEALLAATTNYEETRPRVKERPTFRLDRVRAMLAYLGNPQNGPRTIHIAGSKGKGTVARMLDAALSAAGLGPVGRFTSPHLEDLAERITIDGEPVTEEELATAADQLLPYVGTVLDTPEALSFFEILTGMAWVVFRSRGCRSVVLETGLGGRLDATNVCRPEAVIVTRIEMEHADILGPTLAHIAGEKAGILKHGVPTATSARGDALAVIRVRAHELGCALSVVGEDLRIARTVSMPGPHTEVVLQSGAEGDTLFSLGVAGTHHAENVALAVWGARTMGVDLEVIRDALARVALPGIVEPRGGRPLVVVDGAHTEASALATRRALDACWPKRDTVLLLASLEGKQREAVLAPLLPRARAVVTTELPTPRTVRADTLADDVRALSAVSVVAVPDIARALEEARRRAGEEGMVVATGSVRLAGAVRALT